jgi:phosphoribosylformylglycinamidine synthase
MRYLTEAFPEAEITLTDLAGDDNHWQAEIVSSRFAGIPRVRQHQMVYEALKGNMGGVLHALALKTRAP